MCKSWDWPLPPELGDRHQPEPPEGASPAHTLILDFWPPEPGGSKITLLLPPSLRWFSSQQPWETNTAALRAGGLPTVHLPQSRRACGALVPGGCPRSGSRASSQHLGAPPRADVLPGWLPGSLVASECPCVRVTPILLSTDTPRAVVQPSAEKSSPVTWQIFTECPLCARPRSRP